MKEGKPQPMTPGDRPLLHDRPRPFRIHPGLTARFSHKGPPPNGPFCEPPPGMGYAPPAGIASTGNGQPHSTSTRGGRRRSASTGDGRRRGASTRDGRHRSASTRDGQHRRASTGDGRHHSASTGGMSPNGPFSPWSHASAWGRQTRSPFTSGIHRSEGRYSTSSA